ncbi:sulfatase-like hydrolase/transferase [Leptolyngbya sp. 15MV]|nr:sulfatase-like hydrolase/transferase [Leptolyngbya sp. 15MV]
MDENVGKLLAALDASGLNETTRVIYTSDHGDNLGTRGLWGKCTMYEESAGIPMIVAGPDVPRGAVCGTPVTLLDVSATALHATGASDAIDELNLPGASLVTLANAPEEDRVALSQLHTNTPHGFTMLRTRRHKYVHYVNAPPQLFDLESDPEELRDLAADPAHATLLREMEARLRTMLDPDAVDAEAKAAQAAMIAHHGGLDAIRARERMAYTPPPEPG